MPEKSKIFLKKKIGMEKVDKNTVNDFSSDFSYLNNKIKQCNT